MGWKNKHLQIVRDTSTQMALWNIHPQGMRAHYFQRTTGIKNLILIKDDFKKNIYASSITPFFCLLQMTDLVKTEASWWAWNMLTQILLPWRKEVCCCLATTNVAWRQCLHKGFSGMRNPGINHGCPGKPKFYIGSCCQFLFSLFFISGLE